MSGDDDQTPDRRRAGRVEIDGAIEFIVSADVLNATGVNVSNTGIAFDVDRPIPVTFRMKLDGEYVTRNAQLVRLAQANDSTGFRVGLAFAEDDEA